MCVSALVESVLFVDNTAQSQSLPMSRGRATRLHGKSCLSLDVALPRCSRVAGADATAVQTEPLSVRSAVAGMRSWHVPVPGVLHVWIPFVLQCCAMCSLRPIEDRSAIIGPVTFIILNPVLSLPGRCLASPQSRPTSALDILYCFSGTSIDADHHAKRAHNETRSTVGMCHDSALGCAPNKIPSFLHTSVVTSMQTLPVLPTNSFAMYELLAWKQTGHLSIVACS
jgi:hypothetical protein